jgi:hypothetical protein
VYHARGNFTGTFDQTLDNLRDNTVLAFERNDIVEIQIRKDQQALTFVRTEVPQEVGANDKADDEASPSPAGETIWQTPDGDEGDKSQMERLLSALSDLQCEKYIDGQQKEDFSDPIYTISLKGAQEHTLSVFAKANKDAKSYPAVSSGSEYPFMLPEWQVNSLMKQPAEMLKKQDPPATPTE